MVVSEQLRHLLIELSEVVFGCGNRPVRRANSSLTEQPTRMTLFASLSGMMASYRGWVKPDEDIDCRYSAVAVTRSGTRNTDSGQC